MNDSDREDEAVEVPQEQRNRHRFKTLAEKLTEVRNLGSGQNSSTVPNVLTSFHVFFDTVLADVAFRSAGFPSAANLPRWLFLASDRLCS